MPFVPEKFCPKCSITKSLDSFTVDRKGKLGRHGWCKQCRKIASIRFWQENPGAYEKYRAYCNANNRRYELKRKYGFFGNEYDVLYAAQKGCCAMCKEPKIKLMVDHCHKTGKVRGLLCGPCNISLGHYEKVKITAEIYLQRDSKRVTISHL